MAGLVFLLFFWVVAGACQSNGVGGFYCVNRITTRGKHRNIAAWQKMVVLFLICTF